MKPYFLLAAVLVFAAGCKKAGPEVAPPVEPAGGPQQIPFVLEVKYPPLFQEYEDGTVGEIELPFHEKDQLVVTGEGISGILQYDRFYVFPGAVGFSGYLTYQGPGNPPADLVLQVRRINPSLSHDGTARPYPVFTQNSDQRDELGTIFASARDAAQRYGVYTGTCTFGTPSVELSVATSFLLTRLIFSAFLPSEHHQKKVSLTNGDETYGPFDVQITSQSAEIVWAIPEGMELIRPMLEVEGVARFPVVPKGRQFTEEPFVFETGSYNEDVIWLYDLSTESVHTEYTTTVVYQSKPGPTGHTVSAGGYTDFLFLSHLNVESEFVALSLSRHLTVWVDGECRFLSRRDEAIYASWPHLMGDGTLYARSLDEEDGSAGICISGSSNDPAEFVIGGDVSVVAQGAAGGAGIGTGWIAPSTYNWDRYDFGNIRINTTGTVKATGGAGAAGIGSGAFQNKGVVQVIVGNIIVSGGTVDARGGGGEGVSDIGIDADALLLGEVFVDPKVTWDGVHGYHVARTDDGVPIGYDKD